ncbi:RING finger and CHY zinc finger domain-containing protein 1-like [Zophobas morio]|jgi:hypothetical protein|uniref:RING finger and CHY zinc finger domain-containing protein 1-like n=1 Tax=Zophobas morio TaxID=2755281 RepID=UPI003082F682
MEEELDTVDSSDSVCDACPHYVRDNEIKAECCGRFYGCRLCHDEKVSDHTIDRFSTKKMRCKHCGFVQKVGPACVNSGCDAFKNTYYFCEICKFWSNDKSKKIYHCSDCGICRVGSAEKIFFHCHRCKVCFPCDTDEEKHYCLPGASEDNCPICYVYMHDSVRPIIFMSCGHAIHADCWKEYAKSGQFRCPLCKRTAFQSAEYDALLEAATQMPMPPAYCKWSVEILCNDCLAKSTTSFHFYGNRCLPCKSFNTSIIRTIPEDRESLGEAQATDDTLEERFVPDPE